MEMDILNIQVKTKAVLVNKVTLLATTHCNTIDTIAAVYGIDLVL